MKKIAITITSLIISIKTTALYAVSSPVGLTPPLGKDTDLRTIFMNVLDVAQTIVIMITTLYLIYAGFMFVTAKGDPGKIKTARDALLWGLIGAALILMAEVLALGIGDTVKEVFRGN
jgi:Type IV secretion system pilin